MTTNTYTEAFEKLNKKPSGEAHQAFQRFINLGFPDRKNEAYKYSNMSYFKNLKPNISGSIPHKLPEYFTHEYLKDRHVLVTVNGIFSESLSTYDNSNDGLFISCMCDARDEFRDIVESKYNKIDSDNPDAFSEMNTAFAPCGIFIYAKKNTVAEKPILILNLGFAQEDDLLSCQRNLIVLEENAHVEIIEDFLNLSEDKSFNLNHFSEIYIDNNAGLNLTVYQEEANNFHFIGNKFIEMERDSRLHISTLNYDGKFVRNKYRVNMNGEHAEATLNGVFINENSDHTDNRIVLKHLAPNCQSFQTYRGILSDEASGVFNGKVYVAEGAQKTNAFQSNKNILLSEDAVINTKPELEIYANDVKCSHGATSGQLDENAIFYAESRGIPKEKAKRLIVFAFAQDIIQAIPNEAIKNFMERRLVHKLQLSEYSTYEAVQSGVKE